jgi:hypothetical protein
MGKLKRSIIGWIVKLRFRDWGDVVMGYEIKSGFGIVLRLWAFGYYAIPAAKLDPVN